jgi:hypothetical protein
MSKRQRVEWASRVALACDITPSIHSLELTTMYVAFGITRQKCATRKLKPSSGALK